MSVKPVEVLFIVQLPERVSPGQRFRFELYEDLLHRNGFNVTTKYFLDHEAYSILYKPGHLFKKVIAVLKGLGRRFSLAFSIKKYDYIFLQREAAPVGPPFFEWLYIKILGRKVIYDFDDAIWIPNISEQNKLARFFKFFGKVKTICKWSYKISAGNEYLCNYARNYNRQVVYNPTCVDTDKQHNRVVNHDVNRVTIGWTGSFSTLKYLRIVEPVLQELQKKYDFDVKIICNERPSLNVKNLYFIPWSEANEISELATCQIGLMPLTNDEWSEGKCGFKLIQYLALGIPALSSPVGVNNIIVEEGINGFFCNTDEQWYANMERLILDASLRKMLGANGRRMVESRYSLNANSVNFLKLFS